ncbi:GHMP family kinase ATP-binding protein [[Eubacterium] cellulosolvens]
MIISRTPLRISFAGGGTDLAAFYRLHPGAVTSTAINKYIYVTVNQKFDDRIRVSYSKTEIVDHVDDLNHGLVREAMKLTGVDKGVEITTIADIPSRGTGLGSSSSLTVGLLNALYAYQGLMKSRETLASEACKIEIELLGEPIGKQDQYIAAFGGIQHIQFNPDESVYVDPVICTPMTKERLENHMLLFYTGITRKASKILTKQIENTEKKTSNLIKMKELSEEVRDSICRDRVEDVGQFLHKGWLYKKELASGISNPVIDEYYEKAMKAGALGGKILGAGGGGFMLIFCIPKNHNKIKRAVKDLPLVPIKLEPQGTKIIYVEDQYRRK